MMSFEDKIINIANTIFSQSDNNSVLTGIGDDAAVLEIGDNKLVVTTDILIENTHFRCDIIDPYSLGWKSCAVNLSDIAAMSAKPVAGFVSIGIKEPDEEYIKSILQGMQDISSKYNSKILGGDTVSSKAGLVINITQIGILEGSYIPLRKNAKKDDMIIVTKTLGDSLAGLEALLELGFDKAKE
ncbi:MAG: thiamine-phosphate kinase, partial [Armatimonadota bacterium]